MKKILLFYALFLISAVHAAVPGYHVVKKIQIGGDGFWDYLTVDNAVRRLYVSHGTKVLVIDLETDKLVGEINETPGVHGIALAPELNRGYISCGRADKVIIFDLKTLEVLGQVKTGSNPDAIRYDSFTKRVFVFNHSGNDATVFEAETGGITGTIALGGAPEFSRIDGKGKIYVNIEDLSEVAEIDCRTLAITRRFSIEPGEEPTGMGFDVANHRIFSACSNKMMTVLDIGTGQVIATVPIGSGCDGAGFDAETGLIFCSNGEGTLTVIQQSSPGKFEVAETVPTQSGARTMTIDPTTHHVYLPTARFAPPAEPTPEAPKPRRTVIKDSFCILVVGK
jgi:DNA-binding beta-propeller fold protein YncE